LIAFALIEKHFEKSSLRKQPNSFYKLYKKCTQGHRFFGSVSCSKRLRSAPRWGLGTPKTASREEGLDRKLKLKTREQACVYLNAPLLRIDGECRIFTKSAEGFKKSGTYDRQIT
jgi:hypothetical protein